MVVRRGRSRPVLSPVHIRRRRTVLAALVLLGVSTLAWLVFGSPVLGVADVQVRGVRLLDADEVRTAVAVPDGTPLARIDTDEVAGRVQRLPAVVSARVRRSWPDTLVVEVTERTPVGVLATAAGPQLVDRTGLGFRTVRDVPPGLTEVRLLGPADGGPVAAAVGAALAALDQPQHRALHDQVVAVSAVSEAGVQLTLGDGRLVRFGDAQDADLKLAILPALLTRPGHVYDVAAPGLPTVR
jgi:cell division protein FtsQ